MNMVNERKKDGRENHYFEMDVSEKKLVSRTRKNCIEHAKEINACACAVVRSV